MKKNMKRVRAILLVMAIMAIMSVSAFAAEVTGPMLDLSGVDFSMLMTEILAVVPVVLPVVISFLALRKGISFLKSTLSGV